MDNPLILQLLQKLHQLSCAHKTIHLCLIPSHIGICRNEAADMAAKESLDQDIIVSQVPYEKNHRQLKTTKKLAKSGPRTPADENLIVETRLVSSRRLVCRGHKIPIQT